MTIFLAWLMMTMFLALCFSDVVHPLPDMFLIVSIMEICMTVFCIFAALFFYLFLMVSEMIFQVIM